MELQTDYPAAIAISSSYVGLAFHCLKKAVQNGFSIVEARKGVFSKKEYLLKPKSDKVRQTDCRVEI